MIYPSQPSSPLCPQSLSKSEREGNQPWRMVGTTSSEISLVRPEISCSFFWVYLSFLFIGKDLNPEVIPAYIVMSIPFIEDKTWGNLKYQSQGEIELKSTQFLKVCLGAVRWGL